MDTIDKSVYETSTHASFAIAQRDAAAGSAMEITRRLHIRSPRAADLFINVENGPHWVRRYTGYQISEKATNGYTYWLERIPRYILLVVSYIVAQFH